MSINALVSAEPAATPPRTKITFTAPGDGPVYVSRRDPDRSRPVRGAEPYNATAGEDVILYDYECPFGIAVVYEVGDSGAWSESASLSLDPSKWYPNDLGWSTDKGAVWLKHLTKPKLSMPIDLADEESPAFAQTRQVNAVIDAPAPFVQADTRRKTATSTLSIRTWTLEERDALRAILADNSLLLLDIPAGVRWGLTHWYIAVGDVTETRLVEDWAPFEGRVFALPIEVVERPVGGVVYPDCCYWTEDHNQPDYLSFAEQYSNYAEMASCSGAPIVPYTGCEAFQSPDFSTYGYSGSGPFYYVHNAMYPDKVQNNNPLPAADGTTKVFELYPLYFTDDSPGVVVPLAYGPLPERPGIIKSYQVQVLADTWYYPGGTDLNVLLTGAPADAQALLTMNYGSIPGALSTCDIIYSGPVGGRGTIAGGQYFHEQPGGSLQDPSRAGAWYSAGEDTVTFAWRLVADSGDVGALSVTEVDGYASSPFSSKLQFYRERVQDTANTTKDWVFGYVTGCLFPDQWYFVDATALLANYSAPIIGEARIVAGTTVSSPTDGQLIRTATNGVYPAEDSGSNAQMSPPTLNSGETYVRMSRNETQYRFTVNQIGTYTILLRVRSAAPFTEINRNDQWGQLEVYGSVGAFTSGNRFDGTS